MPVHSGRDKEGHYKQWGGSGKKYYYDPRDEESERRAERKAAEQGQAAYASGYKGN